LCNTVILKDLSPALTNTFAYALYHNNTLNCTAAKCRASYRLTKCLTEMRHTDQKTKNRSLFDTNEKFKDRLKTERATHL